MNRRNFFVTVIRCTGAQSYFAASQQPACMLTYVHTAAAVQRDAMATCNVSRSPLEFFASGNKIQPVKKLTSGRVGNLPRAQCDSCDMAMPDDLKW